MNEDTSPGEAPPPDGNDNASGTGRSAARLMSEVRQAQARADRAERELERTKRSAAYVVGSLLVQAAKDPRRLITLPRDMWRVWRLRKARRTAPRATSSTTTRSREVLDLDATRLLIPRLGTLPAGRGLSVAGALGWATARAWSPYAAVSPSLPHEGATLVEAIDPDVVVIDTSAALPGQAWAHLGDPAASDRLLAAGAMVDTAHALGRPVVLLRMTPPSHTAFLDGLAARCDLVLDGPGAGRRGAGQWHPGIDPLGALPVLPSAAILVASGDLPVPAAAPASVGIDPRLPPALGWDRALGQATSVLLPRVPASVRGAGLGSLAAIAAGRRAIVPGDADLAALLGALPGTRSVAITSIDLDTLGPAAFDALSDDEHRAALAAILISAAAPVQLTVLADRLGLPSRPGALWDVALIADGEIDPDRILAQSWRPREVITDADVPDRVRAALAEQAIEVVRVDRVGEHALLGVTSPLIAAQADLGNPHDVALLVAGHLLGTAAPAHPTDARLVAAAS